MNTLDYAHHAKATESPDWIPEVQPWPEPVHGPQLLDELAQLLRRFVILPPWAEPALALWTLHTYAFPLRGVTTYLGLESPEKRCGKTTLLAVLSELVNRLVIASNISSPAFFRVIEETRPTLLIDEADTFLQGNDELRGILNSGYSRKTAFVVRVASAPATSASGPSNPKAIASRTSWKFSAATSPLPKSKPSCPSPRSRKTKGKIPRKMPSRHHQTRSQPTKYPKKGKHYPKIFGINIGLILATLLL